MTSDHGYVIWSFEHHAWWRAGRVGYTSRLEHAGLYSRAEAERIVRDANVVRINEECLTLVDALAEERTIGPRDANT